MFICCSYEFIHVKIEFRLVFGTPANNIQGVNQVRTCCTKCIINFKFCTIITCNSAKRFTYDNNKNSIFLQCVKHIRYLITVKAIANQHTYFLCRCKTGRIGLAKRRVTCRNRYMRSTRAIDTNIIEVNYYATFIKNGLHLQGLPVYETDIPYTKTYST